MFYQGDTTQLYNTITEWGETCGLFYVGCNRCQIYLLSDCYYVLNSTTHSVLYSHEILSCVWTFMDVMRERLGVM